MARGSTFGQIVTMTRAEAGHSTASSVGRNVSDQIGQTVRRVYERLHGDFSWPHLFTSRDITLAAGQRYYAFHHELDPDRVGSAWYLPTDDSAWAPVDYGIETVHLNTHNPERDERSDPVRRWQRFDDDMLEVWPMPATGGGTLRMEGMTRPRVLNADGDKADLDDQLIALYAAAEILTRQNSADAQMKLDQALSRYQRLRGHMNNSDPIFSMNTTRNTRSRGITIRAPGT